MSQDEDDTILHQDAVEDVAQAALEEPGQAGATGSAIANPASPGASYVQAEVVALRTAIVSILTVLRNNGIIAP